jgi:hypothetical protein
MDLSENMLVLNVETKIYGLRKYLMVAQRLDLQTSLTQSQSQTLQKAFILHFQNTPADGEAQSPKEAHCIFTWRTGWRVSPYIKLNFAQGIVFLPILFIAGHIIERHLNLLP